MAKNVSEFYFETGIIRRLNEGNFKPFEDFFLKRVQDKLEPVFNSQNTLSLKQKYREVLVLFDTRTQIEFRFLIFSHRVHQFGHSRGEIRFP